MKIKKYILGPVSTNCYLLEEGSNFLLIDPSLGSFEKIFEKGKFQRMQIFLTHSHWDHIADLHLWKEHCQAEVWVHPLDAPNVETPGADLLPSLISFPGVKPDHFFKDQEEFAVFGTKALILHTPGHSPGGVCIYFPEKNVLFSGDTLFKGTIGNTSFPTSDREAMRHSLEKLATLPDNTSVYPGHGPETILGEEFWIKNMKKT